MALATVRINSSSGPGGRNCCALISPWPGASTQKARASRIGKISIR
jgi:hypothetical protein